MSNSTGRPGPRHKSGGKNSPGTVKKKANSPSRSQRPAGDEVKERDGYKRGLKPPVKIILYWDKRDGSYWYQLNGEFVAMGKSDLRMQMKGIGLSDWILFDGITETDWPLWRAQMERAVDYAGPLAGHRKGPFKDGGGRTYLVTDEARGIFDDLPTKNDNEKAA